MKLRMILSSPFVLSAVGVAFLALNAAPAAANSNDELFKCLDECYAYYGPGGTGDDYRLRQCIIHCNKKYDGGYSSLASLTMKATRQED